MATLPLSVFISYSHRDETYKEELEDHLAMLKHQGKIKPWQDRQIEAGTEWNQQIRAALDNADIILLLVSSSFMASEFCYGKEMTRAMMRHQNGDARVIPIIIRPAEWNEAPFGKLQVLPKDGKPVVQWPSRDEAFLDAVKGIRRAVDSLVPSEPEDDDEWNTPPPKKSSVTAAASRSSQNSAPVNRRDRGQLYQDLASIPGAQLERIIFTLKPPSENLPGASAPKASRVVALLEWAESPIGPGLSAVDDALNQVFS
jgi:hypothetical protein